MKRIALSLVMVLFGTLIMGSPTEASPSADATPWCVSFQEYRGVEEGMTRKEVAQVLGFDGELQTYIEGVINRRYQTCTLGNVYVGFDYYGTGVLAKVHVDETQFCVSEEERELVEPGDSRAKVTWTLGTRGDPGTWSLANSAMNPGENMVYFDCDGEGILAVAYSGGEVQGSRFFGFTDDPGYEDD